MPPAPGLTLVRRKLSTLGRVVREDGARGALAAAGYYARAARRYAPTADDFRTAAKAGSFFDARRKYGRPEDGVLVFFGGIGDDLMMTVILREFARRGHRRAFVMTQHPEIYGGNPDPAAVLRWDRHYLRWLDAFGWTRLRPHYARYFEDLDADLGPDRDGLSQHILTTMCEKTGIVGPIARKPYLELDDAERAGGRRAPNQIAIQSSGLAARAHMETKQWFPERFQAVVDALRHDFTFVQVGSPSDPPLDGALDLRGKASIRETAAVLAHSLAFVGQVGLLMHVARAVDCRSVIVYGGRETPAITGYGCNENLYSPVPCSPCWQRHRCDYGMRCMHAIEADEVVRAVERQVARAGTPVPVDTDVISTDGVPSRVTDDGRTMLTLYDMNNDEYEIEAKFLPGASAAGAAAA